MLLFTPFSRVFFLPEASGKTESLFPFTREALADCGRAIFDSTHHTVLETAWRVLIVLVFAGVAALFVTAAVRFLQYLVQRLARGKERNEKRVLEKNLFTYAAIAVWAAGYLLYFIGFCYEGTAASFWALLLRPALSSLEMFVSHSDLLEVAESCKENAVYMAFFSAVHFSAVAVSAMFAVNYLGFRLRSWLRWLYLTHGSGRYRLYVFFGVSDASCRLAKDIYDQAVQEEKRADKKDAGKDGVNEGKANRKKAVSNRILFVEAPADSAEEKELQRMSFSHILGLFSYRRTIIERIGDSDAILLNATRSLAEVENPGDSLLQQVGLGKLGALVGKADTAAFFFLSENEDANVKSVLNVLNDKKLDNPNVKFFCHARRNAVNTILEKNSRSRADVKVIDSSFLSVVSLKTKRKDETVPLGRSEYLYHPVNFVDIDTRSGVVTSPFTALIVGFGETGRDVLRFLYEFGAFVGDDGAKSPFKCYVVDEKMEALRGRFLQQVPAMQLLENEVELLGLSCDSPAFWEKMKSIVNELNYVVIAVGDDETGIALLADLYTFVSRYRRNGFGKFRIFVRAYKPENELRLKQMIGYYKENHADAVTLFGTSSEIYKKEMILNDGLLEMSKKFYEAYNRVSSYPDGTWEERRKGIMKKEGSSRLFRLQSVRRKEGQDMANCLHIYTKLKLAGGLERVAGNLPDDAGWEVCRTNLAKCEHLRWNASHYMAGYVLMTEEVKRSIEPGLSCDERTRQHSCLVTWEQLDKKNQGYDYQVVNTSIALACGTVPDGGGGKGSGVTP
ncbi:MAG: hypothetical protein LIP00_06880 [Parabacteroides sp.]|nr:hypothetical protein [Parabacteroides sp.]